MFPAAFYQLQLCCTLGLGRGTIEYVLRPYCHIGWEPFTFKESVLLYRQWEASVYSKAAQQRPIVGLLSAADQRPALNRRRPKSLEYAVKYDELDLWRESYQGEYGVQSGSSDHVGIVEKVEGGRVYTIEGNSGDACERNSYPVGNYQILGYGTPLLR